MKTHRMKLFKEPYTEIKEGRKTVEMRLYDEKRREIAAGDRIIFACADFPGEELSVTVENTYIYEDFAKLAESFGAESLGFGGFPDEYIVRYMSEIYGEEKVKRYGAFAIKMALEK